MDSFQSDCNLGRQVLLLRWLTAFVLSSATLAPALAQQQQYAVVTVRVSDAITEEPLNQADVRLQTIGHATASHRGFTDSSGRISFFAVPRGNYNLVVEKIGYQQAREPVDVRPNVTENYLISLRRHSDSDASPTPGATVSATSLAIPAAARKEYIAGVGLLKDDPAKSAERFQKAIQKHPSYTDAYAMLGLAYIRQNQTSEAMKALSKAVELDPKRSLARTLRGKLYREKREYAEAEADLLESIRLDDQAWDAPFELAHCYYYMGKLDKALEYARRAHDLPQAASATHLLLADLYSRVNDPQAVLRELEEFAKADPHSPFMPRVQQALNELRKQKPN